MRKIAKIILLLILFLGCIKDSFATHVMSAEITYKHISPDSFQVTLKVYRDCNGIAFINAPISLYSGCDSTAFYATLISVKDVTGIFQCNQKSLCNGGTLQYGIEEYTLTATIKLPSSSCCEYTFSWENCCRNHAITTGAANNYYYVQSTINRCLAPTNSSPSFANAPTFLIPVGKLQNISNAAYDTINNDFLTYELVYPMKFTALPIGYNGSFSPTRPLTFLGFPNQNSTLPGGFHFDSLSGNIAFTPINANEVTVVAILVTEWRKTGNTYKKIGTVTRDVQILVTTDTNQSPYFLNPSPIISVDCGKTGNYCIDIPIIDSNNMDTIFWGYSSNIDNITFTDIGTSPSKPVIRVCFPVTQSMALVPKRNQFSIWARDNNCPLPGRAEKTFRLSSIPSAPNGFSLIKQINCKNITISLYNFSNLTPSDTLWALWNNNDTISQRGKKSITYTTKDTGWHYIKLSLTVEEFCGSRDLLDSFYIASTNFLDITLGNDTSYCFVPIDTLSLKYIKSGTPPFKYSWSTGDTTSFTLIKPSSSVQLISVIVTDSLGCSQRDTIKIGSFSPEIKITGDSALCIGNVLTASASIGNVKNPIYEWISFTHDTLLVDTPFVSKQYEFVVVDSFGCRITKQHNVTVYNPQLSVQKTAVCEVDSVPLSAMATGGLAPYNYSWSPFSLSGNSVVVAPMGAGSVPFSITVTDSFGCIVTRKDTVLIHPTPLITLTQPTPLCQTNTAVSLAAFVTPSGGTWSGTGVSGNSFSPSASGAGTFPLTYSYTNPLTGCSNQGQTSIDVQAQPNADFTVDVTSADTGHVFSFTDATQNPVSPFRDWTFGDPLSGANNTSSSLNPSHQFSDTGWFTVRMITPGGVCAADTMIKSNYIYVYKTGSSIGINTVIKNNVKLYPNPAQDEVNIEAGFSITKIQVADALGKLFTLPTITNGDKATIDIEYLEAGTYFIYIYGAGEQRATLHIVVAR